MYGRSAHFVPCLCRQWVEHGRAQHLVQDVRAKQTSCVHSLRLVPAVMRSCICRRTNYESGTRVPLFFRAPWIKSAVGVKSTALAELVDLFPTLSELAGLELPTGVGGAHLGGSSLV